MSNNIDLNIYPVRNENKTAKPLKHPISDIMPDLQRGFTLLLCMPRQSGKSTLIVNLLLNPNMLKRENYNTCYIFSPTCMLDDTTKPLRDHFKNSMYTKYDDGIVRDIINYQKAYDDDERPRVMIVIDDFIGKKSKALDACVTKSRHYNINGIIYSTQALKTVKKTVRTNFTDVILGRIYNQKEFMGIYEEFGCIYGTFKKFKKMFDYATRKKYSFLYLRLNKCPPEAWVNFTENITNKFVNEKNNNDFNNYKNEIQQMSKNDYDAPDVNNDYEY